MSFPLNVYCFSLHMRNGSYANDRFQLTKNFGAQNNVSLRRFFEYPQHMFWLRNKKTIILLPTLTKGLMLVQQWELSRALVVPVPIFIRNV